jgi:hypothetical protein
VRWVFAGQLGNEIADAILSALRCTPAGLTRTEVSNLFSRHKTTAQIEAALGFLGEHGYARCEHQPTNGAPIERWLAYDETAKEANLAK